MISKLGKSTTTYACKNLPNRAIFGGTPNQMWSIRTCCKTFDSGCVTFKCLDRILLWYRMNTDLKVSSTCNQHLVTSVWHKLYNNKEGMYTEFNIILKTWSDIVSDQPVFWLDMIGHLIILKRDVVNCHSTRNQNNYQKSKTIYYAYMHNG
jgi:hypothetical protein